MPDRQEIETRTLRKEENLQAKLADIKKLWGDDDPPILEKQVEIENTFRKNDLILLEAETGSGKSTVAPVILLKTLLEKNPDAKIVVSQPRRIATENLCTYVGGKIGKQYVDYRHKGHSNSKNKPDARITFSVEKSLLNEIIDDPLLSKYDAVMLDEIHEQSVDLALIMALLKKAQAARAGGKSPLKIVLTSATLDREKIKKYFPEIKPETVKGRIHDIEDIYEKEDTDNKTVVNRAVNKAIHIVKNTNDEGDILIFMPGRGEIDKVIKEIKKQIGTDIENFEVIPLLGGDETDDAYKKQTGKRKIIVATNVAETSITINTVRIVIDSGLTRTNIFDENTGMTELRTIPHTKANAMQRRGRAGRTANGKVYYLYSERQFNTRKEFLPPQILQVNLVSQVLEMKAMGIEDINGFDFIDHPGKPKIAQAIKTLQELGALNKEGKITAIGEEMAEYETDPHFARMIVEAKNRKCLPAIGILAGVMSNHDSVYDYNFKPNTRFSEKYKEFIDPRSDFITLLNIWNNYQTHNTSKERREEWSTEKGINSYTLYMAANESQDTLHDKDINYEQIDLSPEARHQISLCIASGLADMILKRDDGMDSYHLINGKKRGIFLDRNSVHAISKPELIISGALRFIENAGKKGVTLANYNMTINNKLLEEAAPYLFEKKQLPPRRENVLQDEHKEEEKEEIIEKEPEEEESSPQERPQSFEQPRLTHYHEDDQAIRELQEEEEKRPKGFFQKVKSLARKLKESFVSLWRRIEKFFTS